jgi:hypothetical protein
MARVRGRNDERSRIAQLAARLMAEDGIEDYALAKRKAARQAGAPDTRQLPTNDEIDEALRVHQALYQADDHAARLHELREEALRAMRELARFNPYLTGSVLSGNAGKYADINLHLYTDDVKSVELYLIGAGISYKTRQVRLYAGDEPRVAPAFDVDERGLAVELIVLDAQDIRRPVRTSLEGKPMERAKPHEVEALLALDDGASGQQA